MGKGGEGRGAAAAKRSIRRERGQKSKGGGGGAQRENSGSHADAAEVGGGEGERERLASSRGGGWEQTGRRPVPHDRDGEGRVLLTAPTVTLLFLRGVGTVTLGCSESWRQ